MAETDKKIEQLKKKMTAKEMQRDKLTRKLLDTKSNIKTLNREIDDIRLEKGEQEDEDTSSKRDTYSTNIETQEVSNNEVSGS